MQFPLQRFHLALASAALLTLAACSGGAGSSSTPAPAATTPIAEVASISGVAADGLIKGASACYDLNDNGVCDAGEPTSSDTGADGGYLLSVPRAEAGKHNVIVTVPATATDSDAPGVPVGTAYTMKAPPQADTSKPVFVSPVTTIVTDVMAASGTKDPADAIASVQSQLGLTLSPLDNFIDKKINGTVQEQAAALRVASISQVVTVLKQQIANTAAASNVSSADATVLMSVVVLNNLSTVVSQVDNKGTATIADLAKAVLVSQNLNTTTIAAQAAAAKTVAAATPDTPSSTPTPFLNVRDFRYVDANNYFTRIFEGDDVADADGFKYSSEARQNIVKGVQTEGGVNTAFYSPNQSAWLQCRLNAYKISKYKQQTATTDGSSTYCDSFRDTSRKTTRSIAGSNIADILSEIRAYPFKDGVQSYATWGITPTAIIGSPTFPAGSELQTIVSVQLNNVETISLNSKIRKWPGPTGLNFNDWPYAATLGDVISSWGGDFAGVANPSSNIALGYATLQAAEVDDPSVTNTLYKLRKRYTVALQRTTDTTGNARFYACNVLKTDGSSANCAVNSNTTYTIAQQADSRILRFAAYPSGLEAAAGQRYQPTERAGAVFNGYNNIPLTSYILRLNGPAWQALRAASPGVAAHVLPQAPVAADAASWLRDMRRGTNSTGSATFNIRWIDSAGTTGGNYSEVRLNFVSGNTVTFARNLLYVNAAGTSWLASDSPDNACASNGVNIGTWTSSPRASTGCIQYKDTSTGFDVDISGKSVTATMADMRLFGSYGGGADYSSYGPLPTDPTDPQYASFNSAVFPAGSRLRYQVSTIVADGESINTGTGSEVRTPDNLTSLSTLASLTAVYTGGFGGLTATGATTYGVYNFQDTNAPANVNVTGQKRVRVGFQALTATSGNALFVGCEQDAITKNTRDCINGTFATTYTIVTLGGKNQLVFAAMPDIVAQQGAFVRSFVEHAGKVYPAGKGFVGAKSYTLRLNQTAWTTVFDIFGVTKPAVTATVP